MTDLSGTHEPTLRERVIQIQELLNKRRTDHARQLLSDALKRHPDSADLLYLAAFADWIEDKDASALATVERALAIAPLHYGARSLRAGVLEDLKRYAEAETVWIDLLREYPADTTCYGRYGELMLRCMYLDKARALAEEGLRHEPTDPRCLYLLALADVIDGRPTDNTLVALTRDHPEHIHTALALIVVLEQRGDRRDALKVAQQLLRARPSHEPFLRMVKELKAQTHWTMLPLYPMQRWGWNGAIVVTLLGLVGLRLADAWLPERLSGPLTMLWIVYVIYSWVWPGIVRKFT